MNAVQRRQDNDNDNDGGSDRESGLTIARHRVRLLGIGVDCLTRSQLTSLAAAGVEGSRRGTVIAHHNLHSAALCRHDARLRRFYDHAEHVHVDGMSLVAVARLVGLPLLRSHRTTHADWFPDLLAAANREHWRVFYLGSTPDSLALGLRRIGRAFPGLEVEGAHGYFDANPSSTGNETRLTMIRDFHPDILFVGMGMPRQEHWIAANFERLEAKVIITSGGCLDYIARTVPTPPRWSGRLGLEWLLRLWAEPRRLAFRYLCEPWLLVPVLVRDLLHYRLKIC